MVVAHLTGAAVLALFFDSFGILSVAYLPCECNSESATTASWCCFRAGPEEIPE